MKSQIERYDERLLQWLDATFRSVTPEKDLQILFAPPDRPYAEVTSGQVPGHKMLRLPRIALSRGDYVFDPARQNPTFIRRAGVAGDARLSAKTAHFPIPVSLPYQLDFYAEYEREIQALLVHFYRQLYAGVLYLTVYLNPLFNNKIISFHLEGGVTNNTENPLSGEFREVRYTVPLRADAWIWDEDPTLVSRVREVVLNVRDQVTTDLMGQQRYNEPMTIGVGDGMTTIFNFGLVLSDPIDPGSVLVFSSVLGAEVRGYDDGTLGVITGTGITGTVNYVTGALSVTFAGPPDAGSLVQVGTSRVPTSLRRNRR